jgi:hypothetical protein
MRAYLDGELEPEHYHQVQAHLDGCRQCQAENQGMLNRMQRISSRLELLSQSEKLMPAREHDRIKGKSAVLRDLAHQPKENMPMWNKMFSRPYRPAMVTLVLVLVLGVSMAFPQVRALATDFLGIFRVRQIAVIPVDISNLERLDNAEPNLDLLFENGTAYEIIGERQEVESAAEASQVAGFDVRTPSEAPEGQGIVVQPGAHATYTINQPQVNAILTQLGAEDDLLLPEELNQALIDVEIPRAVAMAFGTCEALPVQAPDGNPVPVTDVYVGEGCTTFIQLTSPTVSTPDGFDLERYGEFFLGLTGMSDEEAHAFSQRIDWTSTLVVPIPIQEAVYREVQVDGEAGTLVQSTEGSGGDHYVLLWVKGDVIYGVSGDGDPAAALALANSLE